MRILRLIAIGMLPLIVLVTVSYFYMVYKNNIETTPATRQEIKLALDKSIDWILQNQEEIINVNNPALWSFLYESTILNGNNELAELVMRYRSTKLSRSSVWSGYFSKTPPYAYIPGSLEYMKEYQRFFIYGLTCDTDLGEEKFILNQMDLSFCDWKPYYSSCSTHQLMGIRLLQTKNCGDQKQYEMLSNQLIDVIEKQLTWDPRVGDVYIQRVLMLIESGNMKIVKPIWVKNILDAQLEDGAWSKFVSIIKLQNNIHLGFSYKFFDLDSPKADFHATAQAIYLLSLIINKK